MTKTRKAQSADDIGDNTAPPERTAADVIEDVQELVAGLPRLSPSGVETVALRLQVLMAELRGLQE